MDKQSLQKVLEEQLINDKNNDENMMNIVQILGGIDNILLKYLDDPDIILTQSQLSRLYQVITIPKYKDKPIKPSSIIHSTTNNNSNHNDLEDHNKLQISIVLNPNHNYLFEIFGDELANKILYVIYHKVTIVTLMLSIAIWCLYLIINMSHGLDIWYTFGVTIIITLWIPFYILYLLSINKKAVSFIIKSFDFWIKCIYLMIFIAVDNIENGMILSNNLLNFCFILNVIIIALFDGIQANMNWKIMISGFLGFVFLAKSVKSEFFSTENIKNGDPSVIVIFTGFQFSVRAIKMHSHRFLGIFYLKQAFATYNNTAKATSIFVRPMLIWQKIINESVVVTDVRDENVEVSVNVDEVKTDFANIRESDDSLSSD